MLETAIGVVFWLLVAMGCIFVVGIIATIVTFFLYKGGSR